MLEGCTPWPAELAERYRREGYWRGETLGGAFFRAVETYGERVALVYGEERLTYRELGGRVRHLAGQFWQLGLRPLDRVVLQLPNIPEFFYSYLALVSLGAIPVLCLPPHRLSEISYIAGFTEARGYIFPATFRGFDYRELARQVHSNNPGLEFLLVTGGEPGEGMLSLDALLAGPPAVGTPDLRSLARPEEVAVFQLSGGTTGLPKIIPRTHDDYVYNSLTSGAIGGFSEDTIFLAATPIAHNFALACPGAQAAFFYGGRVVLPLSQEPEEIFRCIEAEGVTYVPAVPAMIITWLNSPARGKYDLSSWQVVINGGAKLPPEAARRVRPELGCRLQQIFGMAEGLLLMTRLDDPEEEVFETVGRPISPADEVRIVDDGDREVPDGESGELTCRGPYTLRGYYKAPEHNARSFNAEGFFHTGDVMYKNPAGNYVVAGRKKDLINRGGEKISAEEVENLILSHPAVQNVALVAMPDPVLGERGCAYVILKPGQSLTLPELTAFLLERQIAKFKLPERLEVVESFPLTGVGKVSKKDLREDIAAKLRAEGKI